MVGVVWVGSIESWCDAIIAIMSRGIAAQLSVLSEMVDTAESILQDYRHGFERVNDGGSVGIVSIGCIVGESVNSRQRTTPDGGMVPIMQNVNDGSGMKSDLTIK